MIFGIAASLGFFALKPWVETKFPKDPNEITIPKDDEADKDIEQEEITEPVQKVLTVDDYKDLNHALNQIAKEAQKSIVEVISAENEHAFLTKNVDEMNGVSGVIFADNGQELLILVNTSALQDANTLKVRFADDTESSALLKQKDGNIGMAILAVPKREIKDSTWSKIKVASLGNSHGLDCGDTLIAVGDLFGHKGGVDYGIYSTEKHSMSLADGEYHVIVTDMVGSSKSTGALFDIHGNVIGVLQPELLEKESGGVMVAFGISSIKSEIELMANAKEVPYIGIIGTMVTKEIAEVQQIPEGLYVKEVESDSPALKAGIQSGDVITNIGEKKIDSFTEYHNAVIKAELGKSMEFIGKRHGAEDYVEISFPIVVGIKE